jgi:acetyl-CoA decarbonylase/synthase, CODH/ACS complex subunit delta
MHLTDAAQTWKGKVIELPLSANVKIGGQTAFPCYTFEGIFPNRVLVGLEVNDVLPAELKGAFSDSVGSGILNDAASWAKAAVHEHQADLLFLNLLGTHQDRQNLAPEAAAEVLNAVLEAVGVPVIVRPSGNFEKMNRVSAKCAERARRPVILGSAVQDNYRAVTAAALAGGHFLVTESPIDVNIAKQVNILVSQMNFPLERILMDPLTGALGYGLEYSYSVMERIRIQAFQGDRTMSPPLVCFVGPEVWKIKEVRLTAAALGDSLERGVNWEVTTAVSLMLAGADVVTVRHPRSLARLKACIDSMKGGD